MYSQIASRICFIAPALFASFLGLQKPAVKPVQVTVAETREVVAAEAQAEPPSTEQLIKNTFGDEYKLALAIAKAESSLRADATNTNRNGSIDRGVFQINSIHCKKFDCDKLFDVQYNIDSAKQIKDDSGWSAWSTFKSGSYKKYL